MDDTRYKRFTPRFKAARSNGSALFVVATLGVEDLDGDVTVSGFFGRQAVPMVPAHDATHVPIGKATLYESGNEAIVDAEFNMAIAAARDWYEAIRFDAERPPAKQEYSYAYRVKAGGARIGDFGGHRVRFLQPLPDGSPGVVVDEVSPVLRAAGLNTRTMAVLTPGDMTDLATIRDSLADPERDAAMEYLRFAQMNMGELASGR
jgi:hypothetical protein